MIRSDGDPGRCLGLYYGAFSGLSAGEDAKPQRGESPLWRDPLRLFKGRTETVAPLSEPRYNAGHDNKIVCVTG